MKPFLECIARGYKDHYENLTGFCFVFPNKRSIEFFHKYLQESGYKGEIPHMLTITDFIKKTAGKKSASRIEQLFILYKSYLSLLNNEREESEIEKDFDKFRIWGETVLSDFNTVDQNLGDTYEIFKNVKDLRDISSNFLTEEQKEVMREYFGRTEFGDPNKFWENFNNSEYLSDGKKKFLTLWQILSPLHEIYSKELEKQRLASPGLLYRMAFQHIKQKGGKAWPYKKLIFVGLNALNGAEISIFKELKKIKTTDDKESLADFLWDATGRFLNDQNFSASKFIVYDKKTFPSPVWIQHYLSESEKESLPNIRIIKAPSYTSQVRIARKKLKDINEIFINEEAPKVDTVLVLPDESLLVNTLFALPENIPVINITMGIPLKQIPLVSFMNLLKRNYKNFRFSKGDRVFYVTDLKLLLSHPFSRLIFDSEDIEKLLSYFILNHKVSVSLSEIEVIIEKENTFFYFPEKKNSPEEMFNFLENLLDMLMSKFKEEGKETATTSFELNNISIYKKYLLDLRDSVTKYKIPLSPLGVLTQVDKLISTEKIGFEGNPVEGLQIMGTLETRLLDFKNVIILSMNEGIMPRKGKMKSFIPESLRAAYGLPPAHYSEEIFAYYFYRLISRAENVWLIYDGRSGNGKQGGESRYLIQLKEMVGDSITVENWNYDLNSVEYELQPVEKNEGIMDRLSLFSTNSYGKKNFSASSLEDYRDCEIKFYLNHICGINADPLKGEFIDSITIGTILHDIMMEIYLPSGLYKQFLKKPFVITQEFIHSLMESSDSILQRIHRKINEKFYNKNGNDLDDELPNSSGLVADNILSLVMQILQEDFKKAPFRLWGCEITQDLTVTLKSGRKVNFRFGIDRLDETEEGIRIVDYKTGDKKLVAEDISEVIRGDYKSSQIFQLYTYAWLLDKTEFDRHGKKIITEIYKIPIPKKEKDRYPFIANKTEKEFDTYSEEFSEGIEEMIEEIFTSPAFLPPESEKACSLCKFKRICLRLKK